MNASNYSTEASQVQELNEASKQIKKKTCASCVYRDPCSPHGCIYCLIEGRTRTAQLTPEQMKMSGACPLYKSHRRRKPTAPPPPKPEPEMTALWDSIERLYRANQTIRDIAKELNCTRWQVDKFLLLSGLRQEREKQEQAERQKQSKQMQALYKQGFSDGEIARKLGLSHRDTVRKWRVKKGLPSQQSIRKEKDDA